MAELFLGYPIFPGEDEYEQLGYIMEVLRVPEPELLKVSPDFPAFVGGWGWPLLWGAIPGGRGEGAENLNGKT